MSKEITIYYPSYYKNFHCIADRCRHSCCVGWEIKIDDKTLKQYKKLGRNKILCHIKDGAIELKDDGRCPFLTDKGLCEIISSSGENFVSEICREHPRFYNQTLDRVECGIGASCEEACRIILSSDGYCDMYSEKTKKDFSTLASDFNALTHRDRIYTILSDRTIPYKERISAIKEMYSISSPIHSESEWENIFSELEYLDASHKGTFSIGNAPLDADSEKICERFLAYLIFRHITTAESYINLSARLGFCLLISSVLENFLSEKRIFTEAVEFVRTLSEEIEYSEENTDSLIFEFECFLS